MNFDFVMFKQDRTGNDSKFHSDVNAIAFVDIRLTITVPMSAHFFADFVENFTLFAIEFATKNYATKSQPQIRLFLVAVESTTEPRSIFQAIDRARAIAVTSGPRRKKLNVRAAWFVLAWHNAQRREIRCGCNMHSKIRCDVGAARDETPHALCGSLLKCIV